MAARKSARQNIVEPPNAGFRLGGDWFDRVHAPLDGGSNAIGTDRFRANGTNCREEPPIASRSRGSARRGRNSRLTSASRAVARPAPSGPIRDSPSSRIHSPTGWRAKTDGEIGIDEGPFAEIQRRRSAVAEIRGDHGAHGLRNRKALDQRPVDPVPDRARTGHAETAAGGAQRDARHERAAGEVRGLVLRLIGAGKLDRLVPDPGRQRQRLRPDLEDGRADHDGVPGQAAGPRRAGSCGPPAAPRSEASAAPAAPGASDRW